MGSVKQFFKVSAALLAIALILPLGTSVKAAQWRKATTEEKVIALTFDDGPSARHTKEILALLNEYDAKATFFVIGENAERHPDLICEIKENGHEIGNHSYSHAYISKISAEKMIKEIERTEKILTELTGEKPVLFRPPGGICGDEALCGIEKLGYRSVLWSVDTRDWTMCRSDSITRKVKKAVTTGDIILFHDLEDKRLGTVAALREILPYYKEQGYRFVTVSELLKEGA